MATMTHAIVLLLAAAAVAVEAASSAPRTLRPRTTRPKLGAAAAATQDCQSQLSRCSDCTTLLTCTRLGSVYRPLTTTTCSGTTPYCLDGACVASIPSTDACSAPQPADTSFTCNGDGYFPSPSDCKKYYLCANEQAYEFDCSQYKNTIYSHERALCVPTSEATCATVSCTNANVGVYQQWRAEHSVYFVCTDNNPAHAYVADCGDNSVITASGDCALACLREGRLPDAANADRYFECIQTAANTFSSPIPGTCPTGTTFDAASERCVTTGSNDQADTYNVADDPYYDMYEQNDSVPESKYYLPAGFKIGTASAAYQIEGGWNADGKSVSVWDSYMHSRPGKANGDVACDSYNRWKEDVQLLVDLGVNMYRFSLAWTRLLPGGSQAAGVNQAGVDYYSNLIDELLAKNIEPVVTIHHWDMPQIYQDDGGWLVESIQDRFVDFADLAFRTFGDRVKTWLLLNEPHIYCNGAYEGTWSAPGLGLSGTGGYGCVHNMILAHAKAYHLYNDTYKPYQGGSVGSSLDLQYAQPATNSAADVEAAERANIFTFAWFADPIMKGDYPAIMREIVDRNSRDNGLSVSRLPAFTAEEKRLIVGTMDFIGLNHYSTNLATTGTASAAVTTASISNDTNVASRNPAAWLSTARGSFNVAPWGFREVLNWIKNRYNNFPVLVTENGYAGAHDEGTMDPGREGYYSTYMRALARAMNDDGCNVIGYTAWCLEDNLEWSDGYVLKFGLAYVDFDDDNRPRTLKQSARFIQQVTRTGYAHYVPPVQYVP